MAEPSTYIKLDRNITQWKWYTDQNTFHLFIHIVINANLMDKDWRNETIKRGQLITSVRHLSEETGLSVREVRTALTHLKTTQEVTQRSTAEYTVITVLNYEKYQGATHKPTNERQTSDKRPTTTKEYKEIKNNNSSSEIADAIPGKKTSNKKPAPSFEPDSEQYQLATFLMEKIAGRIPGKHVLERTVQSWAADMDKLNRLDGHEWGDIAAALDFSQTDSFWQTNILSGGTFRKQYDKLYLKMQKENTC